MRVLVRPNEVAVEFDIAVIRLFCPQLGLVEFDLHYGLRELNQGTI